MQPARASTQDTPEKIIFGVLVWERRSGEDWRKKFYAGRKESKQQNKQEAGMCGSTEDERTVISMPHS
jgi:hypothetical protein